MILDVATGYFGGHEEDDKVEEDQRSEDDKENFEGLLHDIKSKYNCVTRVKNLPETGMLFCMIFFVPCGKRGKSLFFIRFQLKKVILGA